MGHRQQELINKWAAGPGYGPTLTQTDLYLLKSPLELHPILAGLDPSFQLIFDLATGQTGGFNAASRDRDLEFTPKRQPATMPRVNQLYIISSMAPWCHVIRNDAGVTLEDVTEQVHRDLQANITDPEFTAIPPRLQDAINRTATLRSQPQYGGYGFAPTPGHVPKIRIDWFRDRHFFERMTSDPEYAKRRLGFAASNVFVMETTA